MRGEQIAIQRINTLFSERLFGERELRRVGQRDIQLITDTGQHIGNVEFAIEDIGNPHMGRNAFDHGTG